MTTPSDLLVRLSAADLLNRLAAFALLQMIWKDEGYALTVPTEVTEKFLTFLDVNFDPTQTMEAWQKEEWICQAATGRWRITAKGLQAIIDRQARLPIDENGVTVWTMAYVIS